VSPLEFLLRGVILVLVIWALLLVFFGPAQPPAPPHQSEERPRDAK
jgi:hypothetical protein